jgi:hypothetical protein
LPLVEALLGRERPADDVILDDDDNFGDRYAGAGRNCGASLESTRDCSVGKNIAYQSN